MRGGLSLVCFGIALLIWPSSLSSQPAQYQVGEIVLQLDPSGQLDERGLGALGYRVIERIDSLRAYRVEVPAGAETEALTELANYPSVLSASLNHLSTALATPNDPLFREFQWDLRKLEMESAWDFTTGDPDLIIAVLDTGVDKTHPDLAPNLLAGYDFLNDDADASDDGSHGTHVAGIIAAVGNNGEGVAGMAWRSRVLPLKVLNAQGLGPDTAVAKGIMYAVEQGARIVNISSGTPFTSGVLREAVEFADRRGVLIIAAAGNTADRANEVVYPAAYPQVLAIAALDDRDQVPPFSQRHPYVSLAAPGVNIASTTWRGAVGGKAYGTGTGTSAAAPHVSALAALLWSLDPKLPRDDLRRILIETADDVGPPGKDPSSGYGRISPMRALRVVDPGVRRIRPDAPPGVPVPAEFPVAAPAITDILATVPPPAEGVAPAGGPRQWYFADGRTLPGFETWLLVQNPLERAVTGRVLLTTVDGRNIQQPLRLDPLGRLAIRANDFIADAEFSVRIEADEPILVERSIYFGHDGSTIAGARGTSRTWLMAEGSTAPPFQTYLVIANPEDVPASVQLIFLGEQGPLGEVVRSVEPHGRITVDVNALLPPAAFSTIVISDVGVVAERLVHFDGGQAGDAGTGSKSGSRTWYFAEGDTRPGFDSWLLLLNPNPEPATVRLSTVRTDGPGPSAIVEVGGYARKSLFLDEVIPNARFAMKVEADRAIVAERAMFFGGGGHSSPGVVLPSTEWFLVEGTTQPPFVESVALLNPNDEAANVEITFYPDGGRPPQLHRLRLRPASRASVDVNRLVPNARVSARITSDKAIVVERALYYQDLRGGTSAPGLTR